MTGLLNRRAKLWKIEHFVVCNRNGIWTQYMLLWQQQWNLPNHHTEALCMRKNLICWKVLHLGCYITKLDWFNIGLCNHYKPVELKMFLLLWWWKRRMTPVWASTHFIWLKLCTAFEGIWKKAYELQASDSSRPLATPKKEWLLVEQDCIHTWVQRDKIPCIIVIVSVPIISCWR